MEADSFYHPGELANFFDQYGQREWQRLVDSPVGEISLYLHTHYLQKYVEPGMRVLEIGAGPGRFTQVLGSFGVRVVVADISPVQLDLNRANAIEHGFADSVEKWIQLDICDQSVFEDASFDCVVVYGGPLSYVLDQRDVALSECMRVLKPGGLLLLSVMSLWGTCHRFLPGVVQDTPIEANQQIIATGDISPATHVARGDSFMHLFRANELRTWLEQAGLKIIALSASGCLGINWENLLKEIRNDEEKWNELLRMELEASATPGCLDMGTHLIAVTQK